MKPDSQDIALRNLLKEHGHVPAARNPAFRSEVWARIEQRRRVPSTWWAWVRMHLAGFTLAAFASVAVASALGGWAAKARQTAMRETMLIRYVASIDPHHQVDSSSGTALE